MRVPDRVRTSLRPIAFGLFAAWLAHSLAPIWPVSDSSATASIYVSARIFYYIAFCATTFLLVILPREPRKHVDALFKALILVTVLGQLITGLLGWFAHESDGVSGVWAVCTFVLSGAMTPVVQIAWMRENPPASNQFSEVALPCIIAGLAALCLLSLSSLPNDLLYSLIPLSFLCLLLPPNQSSEPDRAPQVSNRPHREQQIAMPFILLFGIACALAASHVFNGAAEFGSSLFKGTTFVAILIAPCLFILLRHLSPNQHIDVAATATIATFAILLSISAQGLLSTGATGIANRIAITQALHIVVLASEYLVYILGLTLVFRWASESSSAGWRRFSLPIVNGGVAIGAVSGILVTANILTYTVLSLIFSAAALLLLGISWGIRYAHSHAEPRDTRGERLSSFEQAHGLSEREREVFRLWVSGHQLDYIADALCISKNTVKTHVAHIYKKTETANREELIQLVERR